MITQTHTIIISTPRLDIPENPNVIELINELVHNNLCNIEYFGGELDNQADYINDEMAIKIESSTFITLHFDLNSSDEINYELSEDNILNLLIDVIMENQIREVIVDEKDIEIYIY